MKARTWLTMLGAVGLAASMIAIWVVRARRNPGALSYSQRLLLGMPRPSLSRNRLRSLLAPAPGERLLEIGPGTGYYTLDAAQSLEPGGRLDILDVQQAMLDATMHRARGEGVHTIVPTRGDARALPYPDAIFDGAFLVATLGEVPDKDAALRELRRVLKPGGRLVVGEGQPDPHMVRLPALRARAETADLELDAQEGGALGYAARFRAV
jgi:ubiquinone/menaquinone biosynthesis C-methylase UbiE